jgi:glycine/D-amino acid oxidase-like deaminating enzyme
MWEVGAKSLADGWRQAQEFWNNAARSWGEMTASWRRQPPPPGPPAATEVMATWRELQEAAFAVAQPGCGSPCSSRAAPSPASYRKR